MENSSQIQQTRPVAAAPGWYPDPVTGAGERYWDGIAWSREFTRPGPPEAGAPAAVPQVSIAAPARKRAGGVPPGAIAMAIGALLIIGRIYYIANQADQSAASSAYTSGLAAGNIFGMLLGGAAFALGLHRYQSAKESPTGEPTKLTFMESLPVTIFVTGAGLLAAVVVSAI